MRRSTLGLFLSLGAAAAASFTIHLVGLGNGTHEAFEGHVVQVLNLIRTAGICSAALFTALFVFDLVRGMFALPDRSNNTLDSCPDTVRLPWMGIELPERGHRHDEHPDRTALRNDLARWGAAYERIETGEPAGVLAYESLTTAYRHLAELIDTRREQGIAFDAEGLEEIAGRTCEEGIAHLREYANLLEGMSAIDPRELEAERQRLRDESPSLQTASAPAGGANHSERLQTIERTLGLYRQHQTKLETLLESVRGCDAALRNAALNVGAIADSATRFTEGAAVDLQRAAENALRAREAAPDPDAIYDRRAGITDPAAPNHIEQDRHAMRRRE